MAGTNAGSPKGREPYGDTGPVLVVRVTPHQGGRESRPQGEGGQVMRIFNGLGVCVMQSAETVVDILRARGRRGLPCDELYRQLFNPALFLMAWGRIYANDGAMTPGACGETADGMSLAKIGRIIDALRHERYRFQPVRRVYIPKKNSGCHTALAEIARTWTGTTWFIEGDISDCFGSLDHDVLLSVLSEHIHDNRFLRLIKNMLRAGYLEDWQWNATLSGAPQGGVASPVLSNIYLDRLDKFAETVLIPEYTRGKSRKANPAWTKVAKAMA